jgi:hypothetical protein
LCEADEITPPMTKLPALTVLNTDGRRRSFIICMYIQF